MSHQNLVLVHMSRPEINALAALQDGANIDPSLGVPSFEKAAQIILGSPQNREKFAQTISGFDEADASEREHVEGKVREVFDHPSRTSETQKKIPSVEDFAKKGTGEDKYLCLIPVEFAHFLTKLFGFKKNKETGLLEFFWEIALGAGALLGSAFLGSSSADAMAEAHSESAAIRAQELAWQKEQAKIAQERAEKELAFQREKAEKEHAFQREMYDNQQGAIQAAEKRKEDYLKAMGFYKESKPDNRPWRKVPNPHFTPETAGWTSPTQKEFFDPRTGKAITEAESHKVMKELQEAQPGLKDSYQRYQPTPEESRQRAINEFERFHRPQITHAQAGRFARGEMDHVDLLGEMGAEKQRQKKAIAGASPSLAIEQHPAVARYLTESHARPDLEELRRADNHPSRSSLGRGKALAVQDMVRERLLERSHLGKRLDQLRRHRSPSLAGRSLGSFAVGGMVKETHSPGGIVGKGTGQSDDIHAKLPHGTYIVPADVVSHLGDGSSSAGIDRLNETFKQISPAESIRKKVESKLQKVPVRVANEEYKIDPATVQHVGNGDMNRGAKIFDHFVKNVRKHALSNGTGLPPAAHEVTAYLS